MDQLAEKAQALNDKIDIIGNTASISQKEVAEGIQAVGSVMSDANTSVDEFITCSRKCCHRIYIIFCSN